MQISVYAALSPSQKWPSFLGERLICFAFAGDLALDLFPEFQGMLDFFEYFGGPASATHYHRSVTQHSSQGGLIDHDALDSGEEDFGGPAIHEAGLYNDPLVGDGHLRDIALQQANAKKGCSDEEANKNGPNHRAARGHAFGSRGL